MWVQPKELLMPGPLWVTERANMYFILQRRKGRSGKGGLSALIVGTLDSVRETRPPTYRSALFQISCYSAANYLDTITKMQLMAFKLLRI